MHTAVLLMNLGGPRHLDEVEPYLFDLFSDPAVLQVPLGPLRRPLARFDRSKTTAGFPSMASSAAVLAERLP